MTRSIETEASILLVEDELRVRDAVARQLAQRRYRVLSAKTCKEAVQILGTERPDAMILDLGLPDTDGTVLFRMLRDRGVKIPTIVYTGRMLPGQAAVELRRGGAQVIQKTASTEPLFAAVEQLLGGRWTLEDEESQSSEEGPSFGVALARRLERSSVSKADIPVLDSRVTVLQEFVQNPNAPVEPILEIVGSDPRLAAAVLEQVNSAFYGSANSVTNIRRACIQLGSKRVAALATQVIVSGTFKTGRKPFQGIMKELWVESVVTARLSSRLAQVAELKNVDEMYTLGLLHNIGELLIVDLASKLPHDPIEDEEVAALHQQLQRNHERLGRILMERWELPEVLQQLAGNHHRVVEGDGSWQGRLRLLVLLSWELASELVAVRPSVEVDHGDKLKQLGLSEDVVENLKNEAADWPSQLRLS